MVRLEQMAVKAGKCCLELVFDIALHLRILKTDLFTILNSSGSGNASGTGEQQESGGT